MLQAWGCGILACCRRAATPDSRCRIQGKARSPQRSGQVEVRRRPRTAASRNLARYSDLWLASSRSYTPNKPKHPRAVGHDLQSAWAGETLVMAEAQHRPPTDANHSCGRCSGPAWANSHWHTPNRSMHPRVAALRMASAAQPPQVMGGQRQPRIGEGHSSVRYSGLSWASSRSGTRRIPKTLREEWRQLFVSAAMP